MYCLFCFFLFVFFYFFFFQAEDGIRDVAVTGVQTCALPISQHILSIVGGKHPLVKRLSFRGKEYGFVPNLEEMSFGEYIDLDSYLSDMQQLHKTVGVLYRPIVKEKGDLYEIEPYKGTDGYADFPLDVALGATLFFYRLSNKLLKDTQTSLEEGKKESLISQPPLTSVESGGGMEV